VVSGRIRRFAQGVALKGKSEDRRAYWYNGFQAVGTMYGAGVVLPVTTTLKNIGNLFQGPLLASFTQIWPDYSVDNINRFNNAVFDDQTPSIVPKNSIGQPPLYVIALLPKPEKNSPYQSHFADMVSVAIEGTFIKQVNMVTLAPNNLAFTPEIVSASSIFDVLRPGSQKTAIDALQNASKNQGITLTNDSSATAKINKISISSSNTGASAADFQIDRSAGNCGTSDPVTHAWDPTQTFTVQAHQSCTLYVLSTPQRTGATTATLIVDGDEIEGNRSVILSGSGVGVYVDTKAIIGATDVSDFSCSLIAKKCEVTLVSVTSDTVKIPVYAFADPSNKQTSTDAPKQDGTPISGATCNFSQLPLKPNSPIGCLIPLSNMTSKFSTVLTINGIDITFDSLRQTQTKVEIAPADDGTALNIKATVTDKSSSTPVDAGSVNLTVTGPTGPASSLLPKAAIDKGIQNFTYPSPAPGPYNFDTNYPGITQFGPSPDVITKVIVSRISINPVPDVNAGSQVSITGKVIDCSKPVNLVGTLTSGVTKIAFTPATSAADGTYTLTGASATTPGTYTITVTGSNSDNCVVLQPSLGTVKVN
jgi:hypothetical protein